MKIAIIVGGGNDVDQELAQAQNLCSGHHLTYFVINDMIPRFPKPCQVVTLHAEKLPDWLNKRDIEGYPAPSRVWSNTIRRQHVTDKVPDWDGSSGLCGVVVARMLDFTHIILCGVPMTFTPHFLRGVNWVSAKQHQEHWLRHKALLPPECVRSMSGWTLEQFGTPDLPWLNAVLNVPKFQSGLKA